jgi:hypothetical protein
MILVSPISTWYTYMLGYIHVIGAPARISHSTKLVKMTTKFPKNDLCG